MNKRFSVFVLIFLFFSLILSAQNNKPVIKLAPFEVEGIGPEETYLLETLIQSYLSDLGDIAGYPDADYTIRGRFYSENDGRVFELEITSALTGESHVFSVVYKSTGELALKARSLLETAFAAGGEETKTRDYGASASETISENRVTGTWRGETGIEMVHLHRGGRGIAIFSSGAQMALTYSISNNVLTVQQSSPNSERYYYPLPQEKAKRLAGEAEPMKWELRLFDSGAALRGKKTRTGYSRENESGSELVSAEVLDVEWTRNPR